jgi:hypothetical protein
MRNMTSEARAAFGLTALLAPVLPDDFFRDHWEPKPLRLSRGDAHYYDSVLTNQDLEFIISLTDLRYPAIQLARNGAYLAPEARCPGVLAGNEQPADTVPAHAAERHWADWFVIPGHAGTLRTNVERNQVRSPPVIFALAAGHYLRALPEARRFQFSLRSRYTAMLAGLRTLIQTRHGPDRYVPSTLFDTMPSAPS